MNLQSFKKIIRDLLIASFVVTGASYVYRTLHKGTRVRVVVFHDVSDGVWFGSMIHTLVTQYTVLTPESFAQGSFDSKKINVLITFDDGYESWLSVVMPILEKYNVTALFFINSGLMDISEDTKASALFMKERLHISPKKPLTWNGVEVLRRAGHSIGGHTRTHVHFGTCSATDIADEIRTDKESIQQHLGECITDFAYPFGTKEHLPSGIEDTVQHAGYVRAYTTKSRLVQTNIPFFISRMCIENNTSVRTLQWWMGGSYDLFDILKSACVR
jgi:peptidoglycan/xylan/chitin deacetylase (PgdA/CDA1 family)